MKAKVNHVDVGAVQDLRQELESAQELNGFDYFREWRTTIFGMFRKIIENADVEKGRSIIGLYNHFQDVNVLLETGFIHDAYKHNMMLSLEIFGANWENPAKAEKLLSMLDMYVRPKSAKTEDFTHAFDKASAGMLAYMLSTNTPCPEHRAILIMKQAFGFMADQTVYESLTTMKRYEFPNGKIPLVAKLLVFFVLFQKSVNWTAIKPRAKQGRSVSELAEGLKNLQCLRENSIREEIENAQRGLLANDLRFDGLIKPEFADSILRFDSSTVIDDEMVCAVLFASYFGNIVNAALLPVAN